jgi:hypothetical protein
MFTKEEKFKQRKCSANKIVELALQISRIRCFRSHIDQDGGISYLDSDTDVKRHTENYQALLRSESQLLLELMVRDGVPEANAPKEDVSCKL